MVAGLEKISAGKLADSGDRKVWRAALLAIIFPGLGQLYCGQIIPAILILVVITALHILVAIPSPNLPIPLTLADIGIYLAAFLAAIVAALMKRDIFTPRRYNNWVVYMIFLMSGLVLTPLPRQMFYTFYEVENSCMDQKYIDGDILFVNRQAYRTDPPAEDDIVLYRLSSGPQPYSLGRIWSDGGQDILVKNNVVYLNGYEIVSTHGGKVEIPAYDFSRRESAPAPVEESIAIPEGSYLIIGDNSLGWADESCCGIVPKNMIVGRVEYTFYDYPGQEDNSKEALKVPFYHLFLK